MNFFFLIFSSLLFSFSRQKKNDRIFCRTQRATQRITHVSPPFAHEKRRRTSDYTKKARRTRQLFKRRRQKMFRSSSISFFVLFSSSFSSSFSGMMALGSRIVDGTSRDRDCECRCGETLNTTSLSSFRRPSGKVRERRVRTEISGDVHLDAIRRSDVRVVFVQLRRTPVGGKSL